MSKTRARGGSDELVTGKAAASKRSHSAGESSPEKTTKRAKQVEPSTAKQTSRPTIRANTFGLEFEYILGFKEELLQSTLARYNLKADMVKQFSDHEHRNLLGEYAPHFNDNPSHNCRLRYPSWALHVPEDDIVCANGLHHGQFVTKTSNDKQWIRPYVMEPLLIAKDRLQKAGFTTHVIGLIEPDPASPNDPQKSEIPFPAKDKTIMIRKSTVDYSNWTLTNDHTLIGVLPSQLKDHLKTRGITNHNTTNWDSAGIELISPVFDLQTKDEAFPQIKQRLQSLSGNNDTSILSSVWASLHVHIGLNFQDPKDMPILLLQHLAYILVLHEDLISKCHPRSRSGIPVRKSTAAESLEEQEDEDFDVDDDGFDPDAPFPEPPPSPTEEEKANEDETKVLAFEAEYTGVDNVDSNAQYLRSQSGGHSPRQQLLDIRDKIFQEQGTIFDLISLLQRPKNPALPDGHRHRGYMYNFANLWTMATGDTPWKPIKPTIEFRQHACTTDVDAVRHWVVLLEAIVRAAERKAAQTTEGNTSISIDASRSFAERETSKYRTGTTTTLSWPYESMYNFCVRFLELDEDEGNYWQGRFDLYKGDRPDGI
ncbi:hypothetical protein KCU88_g2899, partial [Aureobasidium melanogenum]